MSINNFTVKKTLLINAAAPSGRSNSDSQSKNSFAQVLKKASAKAGSENVQYDTFTKKNPQLNGLGKA